MAFWLYRFGLSLGALEQCSQSALVCFGAFQLYDFRALGFYVVVGFQGLVIMIRV